MADPKRHHFLPQLYLRNFADSEEGFYQVEKIREAIPIPTKVSKAGSKRDYHTLDWTDQPSDRSSIETQLSKIEGRQDQMLKALIADPTTLEDWRDDIINFVSLMYYRVPAFKRDIEHQFQKSLNITGRMLLSADKLPEPPAAVKKLMNEKGDEIFHAKISNWKLVEQMFQLAATSPIPSLLAQMYSKLLVVDNPDDILVTSDTPVVLFDYAHDPKSPYGKGFAHKSVEVTIPLSERILVMFRHTDDFPNARLDSEKTRYYNQRMIVSAERFLYAPKISDEFLRDVQRLHIQQAGANSSTLDYGDGAAILSKMVPVTGIHLNIP